MPGFVVSAPSSSATGTIESVNADPGPDVVLDAGDVGAEPAGTTATHAGLTANVHGITDTAPLASLVQLLAGFTTPPNSLDRFKAGPGMEATLLGTAVNDSTTTVVPKDASITPDALHRVLTIDDEEFYTTAGETTASLTVAARGTVNGTAAAAHTTAADIVARRYRTVVHLADSIGEGVTTSTTVAGDGWSVRAARTLARRLGGLLGEGWPMWRNTSTSQVHQEYVLTGASTSGLNAWDVGYSGSIIFTAGTANGFVWTRPGGVEVQAFDICWIDFGTTYCSWSYSIDGGTTWIDNPVATTIYSSGQGLLRRTRIYIDTGAAAQPDTIRVRAANAAGTNKGLILPFGAPLVTYRLPITARHEGAVWINLGQAGVKLRTILNARGVADGVTNGTTTLTSATATFVANDVGSTIYVNGTAYTISSRTNGTTVVLSGSPAAATGVRLTIFQGDATTNRVAGMFYNQHGAWYPDLFIVGTYINDMGTGGATLGDANADVYKDMLTYLCGKLDDVGDVLLVAPYEINTATFGSVLQASYRAAIHAVATAHNYACFDMYDAFAAYGYTGYAAINAAGFLADGTHLSALGHKWMGSHLTRALGVV